MTHTPGPWTAKASPESGYFEWIVHGKRITVGVDTDNSQADAKLIAAAPLMYAELKRLAESFGWEPDHPACVILRQIDGAA
jgi:hypothetical protein